MMDSIETDETNTLSESGGERVYSTLTVSLRQFAQPLIATATAIELLDEIL
jgi:hypothetical protein